MHGQSFRLLANGITDGDALQTAGNSARGRVHVRVIRRPAYYLWVRATRKPTVSRRFVGNAVIGPRCAERIIAASYEKLPPRRTRVTGDPASTLRALALVQGVGARTRVLDVGCGTGLQTRVLAQHSAAHFVAIDNHAPFIEEHNRHVHACGLADRIDARVGDMRNLEVPPSSFDVIWCEGAIYAIGFETGLREWRRLLASGGYMALTEVC